jgi:hypothetical protein
VHHLPQLDMEKLCKADSDRLRPLLKDAESAQLHSATDAQRKQVWLPAVIHFVGPPASSFAAHVSNQILLRLM